MILDKWNSWDFELGPTLLYLLMFFMRIQIYFKISEESDKNQTWQIDRQMKKVFKKTITEIIKIVDWLKKNFWVTVQEVTALLWHMSNLIVSFVQLNGTYPSLFILQSNRRFSKFLATTFVNECDWSFSVTRNKG